MKVCMDCGTPAGDNQLECLVCKKPTAWRRDDSIAIAASVQESEPSELRQSRPDGSKTMFWGFIGIALGILLILLALAAESTTIFWNFTIIGAGLAQLGLVFWLAGYVVKAISFLPGKDQ